MHTRHTTTAGLCLAFAVLLIGTPAPADGQAFEPAPDSVLTSFTQHIEGHWPQMVSLIRDHGYHLADAHDTSYVARKLHVSDVRPGFIEKGGSYEATLTVYLHQHDPELGGFAMPEHVFMDFVRFPEDTTWYALVERGDIYSVGMDPQTRLPLGLREGLLDLFQPHMRTTEWLRRRPTVDRR